jgi:hypothetical protein
MVISRIMPAVFVDLAATTEETVQLTVGGAMIMTVSVLLVLGLNVFCLTRILRDQDSRRHHAPLDIDTRDRET